MSIRPQQQSADPDQFAPPVSLMIIERKRRRVIASGFGGRRLKVTADLPHIAEF